MFHESAEFRELLDAVLAQVREHVPADQRSVVEDFVTQYYAGTALEDLSGSDFNNLRQADFIVWIGAQFDFQRLAKVAIVAEHRDAYAESDIYSVLTDVYMERRLGGES